MKCDEFRDMIGDTADKGGLTSGMREHMGSCSECARYYDGMSEAVDAVTPRKMPYAPPSLMKNVMDKVSGPRPGSSAGNRVSGKFYKAAAVAAAVALAVVFTFIVASPNDAIAARTVFGRALPAMGRVRTMVAEADIRTTPRENFSAIHLRGRMVPHTVTVVLEEHPMWRVEKSGRTAMFDGGRQYQWVEGASTGYSGGPEVNFVEWREMFLDPAGIMAREKAAAGAQGTRYRIKETDTEIYVTVKARARGDFSDPYMRNNSVVESDNVRKYVFDKATGLPKSAKIYVRRLLGKVLVVDVRSIEYDIPVNETALTERPADIEWRDLSVPAYGEDFSGITAVEAARKILEGMASCDFESIASAIIYYDAQQLGKDYGGLSIVSVGKPFRSGLYPGVFVPCKVTMPDGGIRRFNMALRNDNPNGVWLLDGGV